VAPPAAKKYDIASDVRHSVDEKPDDAQRSVPTFAIAAVSFAGFLVFISFVSRRSGRSRQIGSDSFTRLVAANGSEAYEAEEELDSEEIE